MMTGKGGLVIFIGALGMMATLLAGDVSTLTSWSEATTPLFIAKVLFHFGTVVAAYVGGKLTERSA